MSIWKGIERGFTERFIEKGAADEIWQIMRQKRNEALRDSDCVVLPDYPHKSQEERRRWIEYRQHLRDLPKAYNDESISRYEVKDYKSWCVFKKYNS